MIDLNQLTVFITKRFPPEQLYIDRFKEDVLIVDIDCLRGDRKLTLRATDEKVEFSTISKEPELDFSLYDYSFNKQEDTEKMITAIQLAEIFLYPDDIENTI